MDPRAKLDILHQAIYDAKRVYNKNYHPTLDKNDYEILWHLYKCIERSVKDTIETRFPDVDIKDISPKIIFITFLKQEYDIDLSLSEANKIINK